jgi:hypothetical protein
MKNTEKKGIMKPTDNIGCAVQWNFPEMRHLERQFLPIEHRYVNPPRPISTTAPSGGLAPCGTL